MSINTFAKISPETPVKFLRSSCYVYNIKHKLEVEIITLLIEIYRPVLKPLFSAAGTSNYESIQKLIEFGADVNMVDRKGQTAMFHLLYDLSSK